MQRKRPAQTARLRPWPTDDHPPNPKGWNRATPPIVRPRMASPSRGTANVAGIIVYVLAGDVIPRSGWIAGRFGLAESSCSHRTFTLARVVQDQRQPQASWRPGALQAWRALMTRSVTHPGRSVERARLLRVHNHLNRPMLVAPCWSPLGGLITNGWLAVIYLNVPIGCRMVVAWRILSPFPSSDGRSTRGFALNAATLIFFCSGSRSWRNSVPPSGRSRHRGRARERRPWRPPSSRPASIDLAGAVCFPTFRAAVEPRCPSCVFRSAHAVCLPILLAVGFHFSRSGDGAAAQRGDLA